MIEESLRIKLIRVLLGMNGHQFAEALDVGESTVCMWLKGIRHPIASNRRKMALMCEKAGIMFLPSGYPIPKDELIPRMEPEEPIEKENFAKCLKAAQESSSQPS